MANICPECGAPLPQGGSCRDNFKALLRLQAQMPGGPGAQVHFLAVTTYGLQHPDSIGYTLHDFAEQYQALDAILDGRAGLEQLHFRSRVSRRRNRDNRINWYSGPWSATIADVLVDRDETTTYTERITHWASATLKDLRQFSGTMSSPIA